MRQKIPCISALCCAHFNLFCSFPMLIYFLFFQFLPSHASTKKRKRKEKENIFISMERNAKERKSKPRSARRSAKRVKVAAGHKVNKTSTSGGTAAPPKTPNLAKQGSTGGGGGSTSAGSRSASRRSSSTSGGNGNSRKCSRNTEVDNSDTGDDSALRHEVIHELIHQVVTTSIY